MGFFAPIFVLLFLNVGHAQTPGAPSPLPLGLPLDEFLQKMPDGKMHDPDKVKLGKMIFWDTRWSTNKQHSCVACHLPDLGWSGPKPIMNNTKGPQKHHSPTVINLAYSSIQGWQGHRKSVAELSAKLPDVSPESRARLQAIPEYAELFKKVYGDSLKPESVEDALSAYVDMIVSGDSAYDRFIAGDKKAMSASAQRGFAIFKGKGACIECHSGFNFTDGGFHNIGVGAAKTPPDVGRFEIVAVDSNKGAYKTPTLRDVAKRPFFMHDGSLSSLDEVVDYYAKGTVPNAHLSKMIKPFKLSKKEKVDLIAFMKALTGKVPQEIASAPTLPQDPPAPK